MIFSSVVPQGVRKGAALVDYLAGRFTYHSAEEWRGRIAAGSVAHNGRTAQAHDTVAAGDAIAYDAGEFDEPPADLSYRIRYEDEWLLGIDKPGNLLVHRAGRSFRNNLIYQLRSVHVPPYPAAHAVHRLDRDTSGVVLVAKDAATRTMLGRAFAEGRVAKVYGALVAGTAEAGREIDLPIGKKEGSAISYKYAVTDSGKPSKTVIISSQPVGTRHSLVMVRLLTGRTHQIRVHLAAIGAPVVGDKLYGLSEADYLAWRDNPAAMKQNLAFHRHALHCCSLTFEHPHTKKECCVSVELPEDMKELIERLSKEE
jgi:RluA family pseudouridine synthase